MNTNIFGIGPAELVFIAIIALIVLGPKRLPEVMRQVAGFIRQVRAIGKELTSQFSEEIKLLDEMNPQRIFDEATRPENDKAAASKAAAKKPGTKSSTTKSASAKPTSTKSTTAKSTSTKPTAAKSNAQKANSATGTSSKTSDSQSTSAKAATDAQTEDQADQTSAESTPAIAELSNGSEVGDTGPKDTVSLEVNSTEENSIAPPEMREAVRAEENTIAPPEVVESTKAIDSAASNGVSAAEAVQNAPDATETKRESASTESVAAAETSEIRENDR